jgi:hypothetical protein
MAGAPWSDELVERLRQLHAQGMCDRDLARELGESHYRVIRKRYLLGLPPNPATLLPSVGTDRVSHVQAVAENEQPWEPLPGMLKLRCLVCNFWFASPSKTIRMCPDCRGR